MQLPTPPKPTYHPHSTPTPPLRPSRPLPLPPRLSRATATSSSTPARTPPAQSTDAALTFEPPLSPLLDTSAFTELPEDAIDLLLDDPDGYETAPEDPEPRACTACSAAPGYSLPSPCPRSDSEEAIAAKAVAVMRLLREAGLRVELNVPELEGLGEIGAPFERLPTTRALFAVRERGEGEGGGVVYFDAVGNLCCYTEYHFGWRMGHPERTCVHCLVAEFDRHLAF